MIGPGLIRTRCKGTTNNTGRHYGGGVIKSGQKHKGCVIVLLVMKTLSCRDAGCDCDYIAKGETEEDVMKDAAQHGMKEHGKTEQDMSQLKGNLRGAIHTS